MSKKVNASTKIETATTATNEIEAVATPSTESPATDREPQELTMPTHLQEFFSNFPNASLRKLAAVTGVNYGILLKKSKEPVEGQPYDPDATNWDALEAKLTAKKVDWTTLNWVAMNEGPSRKGGMLQKSVDAFKVGDKVYLRRDNTTPYEILYKTETHVVIMKVGSTEPQAWANNTFLINGPVFEPRATKVTADVTEEAAQ